jgi:hypothetical protein
MRIAFEDLELARLVVVYPGTRGYPLAEQVHVLPLAALVDPDAAELLVGND